jgi:hypothetical protein
MVTGPIIRLVSDHQVQLLLPSFIYFVTVPLPDGLNNIPNELWIAFLLSEFLDLSSCLIGELLLR